MPGFPLGQVFTRPGTFACASQGLTFSFKGRPAHAAYPEDGLSPAQAVGELLCKLPALTEAHSQGNGALHGSRSENGR
ncbi:peptidase dimerization domain-containing protein [uncultured Mailhella sp.]|uniref:peptidase dimerization domain-containing protein n=1 Tax=uncultured Mailhella sp. TaxID=1981031 RepID=UPI00344C33B8